MRTSMKSIRSERETIEMNQIEEIVPIERSLIKEIVPQAVREKRRDDPVLPPLPLLQERHPVQPMSQNSATVAEDSCPTNILRIPVGIFEIDLRVGIRIINPSLG